MSTQRFKIHGMDCAEEIAILKRVLAPLVENEESLAFDLINGKLTADAPDTSGEAIEQAVRSTGMRAIPWEQHLARQAGDGNASYWIEHGRQTLCALSGGALLLGAATHTWYRSGMEAIAGPPEGAGYPLPVLFLYALAILSGAWFVAPKAWYALKHRRPDMNLLMIVAIFGAIVLGEWFEAGSVAFLFSLALLLESWSVGRARRAIGALVDLSPPTARIRRPHDGDIDEKPVNEVTVGATVLVRPGERVPLDGTLTLGSTTINQAPITGESMPAEKTIGDPVYAGSINQMGAFEFDVTRAADDTTLARIIHMVEEAQSRRAPSEQWVERFARYYTPAMMALAIVVAVLPPLFTGAWGASFYQALVILVIACPCALVISTPVSIVAGLTTAARNGVLIKGGIYLEAPARLRAIAFDKTGTLTTGKPAVQKIIPLNGHDPRELLERAAALEVQSNHPLAHAILEEARQHDIAPEPVADYRELEGRGAEATFRDRNFWIGSHRLLHEKGVESGQAHDDALTMEDAGHSVLAIGNDDHLCGLISVADAPRDNAADAIADLKAAGIEHIALLTGDNMGTARSISNALGIDETLAELLPEEKVAAIETLRERFGAVAMIGDGINDAPALATATIGIAMGAAGSDAAIETADIALMSDDLGKIPWLIRHSRHTLNIIKQNIAFALGLKLVFIVLAFAGLATLWMAIAADMGASLIVIANALRLLRD